MEHDKTVSEAFSKNFYYNRNRKLCCDLLLITNDDVRIEVHKIVLLSSTSLYLQTLIEGNIEASELYLPICSMQLKIIIRYLYTGDVNVTELSETKALYENGKTFMLPFLQKYSTNKLLSSITMDFCLEYFRYSVKFSIQILEEKCLELIAANTKEFFNKFLQVLSADELEKIIEIRHKLDIDEIDLYRNIKKWIFLNYDIRKFYIDKYLLENIDFLEISSKHFHDEIENDIELANNNNFLKKIMAINKIKENSILKGIINENYSPIVQESLYYIASSRIRINKINIENEDFEIAYQNDKYCNRFNYAIGNFKYDNRDYFLISGGHDIKDSRTTDKLNLIWSPDNIKSDGDLKEFPSLLKGRVGHRTVFCDGKIYVCGGFTNNKNSKVDLPTKTTEIFNFGQEKWSYGAEFVNSKVYFGLTPIEKSLYAVGGSVSESYVELMDTRINKWNVISPLYKESCRKVLPCFDSSLLCLSQTGFSFIFDMRNNKFTNDIHYNCMENYLLLDVVKFNNEYYGFYRKDTNNNFYIYKYDQNYKKEWKVMKSSLFTNTFGLLTISD